MDQDRFSVRPSLPEDAKSLAPRLRTADWIELEATGLDPALVLSEAVERHSLSLVLDGQVEAMFGCVPAESPEESADGIAYPWLLGSAAIGVNPIRTYIIRHSKAWLALMHEQFPTLINAVWQGNKLHLRWLEWLGFDTSTRLENYAGSGKVFRLVMSRKGTQ